VKSKNATTVLLILTLVFVIVVAYIVSSVEGPVTAPTTMSQTQLPPQQTTQPDPPMTENPVSTSPADTEPTEPIQPTVPDVTVPVPATDPETKNKVSFFAVGDNIVHGNVYRDANIRAGGSGKDADFGKYGFNFLPIYDNIADMIKDADVSFINQETLVAAQPTLMPSGYPTFNTPAEMGDALVELGFDVVNIASNHSLDMGESGYNNSIDYWNGKEGITLIGGYKNEDDFMDVRVLEKNGIKIAFVSFTYKSTNNCMGWNENIPHFVPFLDDEKIIANVRAAKQVGDVVIASMHWGDEDVYEVTSEQRRLAKLLADEGVDVILGHHSHLISEVEWKERPDGGKTLVIYSMGNLVSTMLYLRNMVGGAVNFDIIKQDDGTIVIENVLFTPTFTYYDSKNHDLKVYLLEDVTQELLSTHGSYINMGPGKVDSLINKVKEIIHPDFLSDFYK